MISKHQYPAFQQRPAEPSRAVLLPLPFMQSRAIGDQDLYRGKTWAQRDELTHPKTPSSQVGGRNHWSLMVVAPSSNPRTCGGILTGTLLRCHFISLHLLLVTDTEISRGAVASSIIKACICLTLWNKRFFTHREMKIFPDGLFFLNCFDFRQIWVFFRWMWLALSLTYPPAEAKAKSGKGTAKNKSHI